MEDAELTFIIQDASTVLARRQDGAESRGTFVLNSLDFRTIGVFEDWLNRGNITRRLELEVFGTLLYRVLFSDQIGHFFEQSLDKARKAKQRLRVQLGYTEEAADLANLPWEYLYYPGIKARAGFFLATNVDLVFSRYVQLQGYQALEPAQSPLRILIVVSNPEYRDLPPVGAAQIIEAIQTVAESYPIQINILDKPTIDGFLDKLQETQPHVLHFIGHGLYSRDKREAEIALLDKDEKSVRWVRDDVFVHFFTSIRTLPRLVFLHCCESATTSDTYTAGFTNLALQLVRVGVQAVVAMRYPIPNNAAIVFSRAFYRALAKGESIDVAVQEGRWRITSSIPSAYNNRVFGTPVLYMSSRDAVIRPVEETAFKSIQPKRIEL